MPTGGKIDVSALTRMRQRILHEGLQLGRLLPPARVVRVETWKHRLRSLREFWDGGANLIRSLSDKVGPVRAEGTTIHVGSRVGIAEAFITGVDGKPYAHATTTCLIFRFRRRIWIAAV